MSRQLTLMTDTPPSFRHFLSYAIFEAYATLMPLGLRHRYYTAMPYTRAASCEATPVAASYLADSH
jgi:hypothetical protein